VTLFTLALSALLLGAAEPGPPAAELYRATFVQAAPGRLLELIELEKGLLASYAGSGDEAPFWMRHSQGDKWDLLVLSPMGSWQAFFSPDRVARREKWRALREGALARIRDAIAWQEDLFVFGPPPAAVRERFAGAGFFHVEIFVALPGRQRELYREREMENAYQRALDRPVNLIFTRDAGAAWDLFTIGAYRDLKHYAESADIPEPAQESAAKAAGFDGAKGIGPYLRTLIREHHDTLATAIR
jgi:hypothetical protein